MIFEAFIGLSSHKSDYEDHKSLLGLNKSPNKPFARLFKVLSPKTLIEIAQYIKKNLEQII